MNWTDNNTGIPAIGDLCLIRMPSGKYLVVTYRYMTEDYTVWHTVDEKKLVYKNPTHWVRIQSPVEEEGE